MEENKNEEVQEDTQEVLNDQKEEIQETEEKKKRPANGVSLLWVLAGFYLLYTAYELCKGYLSGAEDSNIGFMLIGVVFAVIGVGLLVVSVRNALTDSRLKQAKEAKDAAVAAAADGELKDDNKPEVKKSMSIADRANLTKRLEEEDQNGDDVEE